MVIKNLMLEVIQMLNLLNWDAPLKVNGTEFANSKEAYKAFKSFKGEVKVELNFNKVAEVPKVKQAVQATTVTNGQEFKIKVRQYMTKEWEFNTQWNNGVPMPMRIMVGKVIKETKGMVQMELHGHPMPSTICCKCGRTLTHPVSLLYGVGPECGKHFHINPYETQAELDLNYEELKNKMAEIKWTGWVIKSAIEEKEEI